MTLGLFTFIAETEEQAQVALVQLQQQPDNDDEEDTTCINLVAHQIYHDNFGNYEYKNSGSWVLEVVTDIKHTNLRVDDCTAAKFVKWQRLAINLQPPTAKHRFNELLLTSSYN